MAWTGCLGEVAPKSPWVHPPGPRPVDGLQNAEAGRVPGKGVRNTQRESVQGITVADPLFASIGTPRPSTVVLYERDGEHAISNRLLRPDAGTSRIRPNSPRKTQMPQELDEVDGPDELIEGELEELEEVDDLIAEDELGIPDVDAEEDGDADVVEVDVESEVEVPAVPAKGPAKAVVGEESDDDEEEEPDDEDVEASLDTILKERLVVEEVEDDEEAVEPEERSADGVERVLPKQPGEFVCRSCFLVKHPNQLANKKRMLCRDCV